MITSIRNIKQNFFQRFLGTDPGNPSKFARNYVSITDYDGAEILQIPFRYFHLSSADTVQAPMESYPVIAVQDFMPRPVDGWNSYPQKRYAGLRDTDNDGYGDATSEQPHALRLTCRYEVSVAAKTERDFVAITDWFYRTFDFSKDAVMYFNQAIAGDVEYGDPVNYQITDISDNPRSDGLFENVYVFELNLWADIKPAVEHTTLLKEVLVQFNNNNDLLPQSVTAFGTLNTPPETGSSPVTPIGVSVIET